MIPMTEEEEYRNAGITKEEAERKPEVETVYKDAPVQMELDLQEAKEVNEPDPRQTEFDFEAEPFVPKLSEADIKHLDKEDEEWKKAKAQWKDDNPNELIKTQKVAYAVGKIEEFPWEKNYQDMKVKKTQTESEKMQDELEPINNELDTAMAEVDDIDQWNTIIDSATEAAEAEDQKKKFESTNYWTKVSNKQTRKETKEASTDETTTQK